jgi:hypothetical protein
MNKGRQDFDEWFAELRALAMAIGWKWDARDPLPWMDYHADGHSPVGALSEEMSYAD